MVQTIDLCGEWRVRQAGKRRTVPATVPGNIHTDLLDAGRIPDPFYRDNEQKLMWIGEADWIYTRAFDVPAGTLDRDRVLLRCEGLDTLAAIRINGRRVGAADNMFRTWEFDVKRALRAGRNTIEVRLASPLRRARREQAKRYMMGVGVGHHKLDGGNRIRKEQCNFGWDWGPMCVTCGIWLHP